MHDLSPRSVFFVEDTPRAIEFYTGTLGFNLDWTYEENGRPYVVQVSLFGLQITSNGVRRTPTRSDYRAGFWNSKATRSVRSFTAGLPTSSFSASSGLKYRLL